MDYQSYLDEKLHQLKVVCHTQWDYIKYSDVCRWLDDNFGDDIEGRYYATKILLDVVYYKKKDIVELLDYGLHDKIYGEIIKKELVSNKNIYIPNSEANAKVNNLKQKTYFIPLLDSNKPHESGNSITGEIVHKLGIKASNVDFHWNVDEEKLKHKNILIFVDDCIGSGNQLKKFWNSSGILKIRELCEKLNIKIYYLVLVAYRDNVEKLVKTNEIKGIQIVVCDLLTDKNRIFSDENLIWDKETNELQKAIEYFENIRRTRGISFLGFKKLDFAVILHDRLPNWSLPLFWKNTLGWKQLITRKTSN